MNLVLDIALTHVRFRARQTLVAVAGVATGVGFSIMMAALMEGSQNDFMRQLIDALPHITVSDERRACRRPQPAEAAFAAAEIHGLTPEMRRRGIKNPMAIMAVARGLGAGRGRAVGEDAGAHPLCRPRRRRQRARHRSPSRAQGVGARHPDAPGHARLALPRHQRHHPRRPAGREDRRARRRQHHGADERRRAHQCPGGRPVPLRRARGRREHRLRAGQDRADPRPADRAGERAARARRRSDGGERRRRSASSARPATSRWPGRRRTRTCSAPS